MTYRDDLEAAGERAHALERDLARAEDENERLRKELEDAKNPPPAPPGAVEELRGDLALQVAQGRALREASEKASRKVALDEQVARMRAAERAFPVSITPWGYYARWPFVVGCTALFCGLMGFVYLQSDGRYPPGLSFLAPPAVALLLFAVGRARVKAALPREQAWVASLPFKLIGYELFFTGNGRRIKAVVRFKRQRPREALLRDAVLVLDPDASVYDEADAVAFSLPVRHHKGTETTINRRAHLRLHELVGLLLKIHAEYPIESVHPELD